MVPGDDVLHRNVHSDLEVVNMAEYLQFRCCMCPNINLQETVCPGIKATPHSNPSECRFVKVYADDRGWIYFVRSGIGSDRFKPFYSKNKEDFKNGRRQHGMGALKWREKFDDAQSDLNQYAKKKGWKVYERI